MEHPLPGLTATPQFVGQIGAVVVVITQVVFGNESDARTVRFVRRIRAVDISVTSFLTFVAPPCRPTHPHPVLVLYRGKERQFKVIYDGFYRLSTSVATIAFHQ